MQPLPEAIRAINRADYILIGPGSLYTSIIPNLLVKEIGEAVVRAKGRKIYVCNLMTQKVKLLLIQQAIMFKLFINMLGIPLSILF